MRKLVHIEKIHTIEPIEGADNIELVKLLDWQCIAKKGEFKIGDLAVYHEIDSVCPDTDTYSFLKNRKFRISTIKLKGQLSQGLALPLSILPKSKFLSYKEGQDVTDTVGVVHYDKEHLTNIIKQKRNFIITFLFKLYLFRKLFFFFKERKVKDWPTFIPHTDEENVQAIFSKIKEKYGDKKFYVTEKIDYQSATYFTNTIKHVFYKTKIFGVCSRTIYKRTKDDSLWWKQVKNYDLEKKLLSENFDVIVQGESGDTSVQKNIYKITKPKLWIFNVINKTKNYYFNLNEMEEFCKKHKLDMAPVLDRNFTLPDTVSELLEYSKGKSTLNNSTIREGIVIRLIEDGKKLVSFKVKNPDFLIKFNS